MSIQTYTGPSGNTNHGAIVPVGAAKELTQEEYEKRQKDVSTSCPFTVNCVHSPEGTYPEL